MAVVDDFGKQVVQRLLVGAADIHARPAADGFEPFEHLDMLGGIAAIGRGRARGLAPAGLPPQGWEAWRKGQGLCEQVSVLPWIFKCFAGFARGDSEQ